MFCSFLQHYNCPETITNGFKVAGVYPLDKDVFADDEFAPCYVTDRPEIEGGVQQSEEILIARPIVSEASEHEKDPAIPSENCNMGEEQLSEEWKIINNSAKAIGR